MKIKDQGDWIELNVIVEKFKEKLVDVKDENGKLMRTEEGARIKQRIEILDSTVLLPTKFLKNGISMSGPALTQRFRVCKNRTSIYDTYTQRTYDVQHKPEEVFQGLMNKPIIGFQVGKQRR